MTGTLKLADQTTNLSRSSRRPAVARSKRIVSGEWSVGVDPALKVEPSHIISAVIANYRGSLCIGPAQSSSRSVSPSNNN